MGMKGMVASTAGLAILLDEGIGDTIRVSLTPAARRRPHRGGAGRPAGPPVARACARSCPRSRPARAAAARRAPSSRRWPSGSRRTCASEMPAWAARYPGVEEMRVAVMGCVVNGPGESKHADIGISLPGTFEEPVAPVFVDGALRTTLRGEGLVDEFIAILDDYVERRYGGAAPI